MKYHLHLIAMLSLAMLTMTSCENSSEELGNEAKKETLLSIRVSRFDVIPFDTRAEQQISDYCKRLHFVVFQGTKEVKRINQSSTDTNFGSVSMTLTEGSYQIVVIAHSSSADPSISNSQVTFATGKMSDVFYYSKDIAIAGEEQNIDMELARATSMFRFKTKDNVPTDCKLVDILLEKTSCILDLSTGLGGTSNNNTYTHEFVEDEIGKPFQMEVYCLLNEVSRTITVTVTARKLDGTSILKSKEFKNVPMEKNKITQYSGYFFGDAPSGGDDNSGGDTSGGNTPEDGTQAFKVTISSDWAGTNEYTF